VITRQDIQRIASSRGFGDPALVEKDYALTWALKAIYGNPVLSDALVFKGGTCISKVYVENYRLSEDLDFSLAKDKQLTLEVLVKELSDSFEAVKRVGGPEMHVKRKGQLANPEYLSAKIGYVGPLGHPGQLKVEVSLTEKIIYAVNKRRLKGEDYADVGDFSVTCYDIHEVMGEKVRAILQRGKSRDYYDVWKLMTSQKQTGLELLEPTHLMRFVWEKCRLSKVEYEPELMFDDSRLKEAKNYWAGSLGRLVLELPDFEEVVADLKEIFFVVHELSLFSTGIELEHLDNIYRSSDPNHNFPILTCAQKPVKKKLKSKKKSEVLRAIEILQQIAKKGYAGHFTEAFQVLSQLQGDRDKEIRGASFNASNRIREIMKKQFR